MILKDGLLLGRKAMTKLDSILKNRHYFANKSPSSQTFVFLVVMCGCESWTIKKVEHQKIDAFELWCWSRLLRAPWTARRSNQSILNEIGLNIHWKSWLAGKDPDAGKDWGLRWRGQKKMRRFLGIIYSVDVSLSKLREIVRDRETVMLQFMGLERGRHN